MQKIPDTRDWSDHIFREKLQPGERLLWSGKPGGGLLFQMPDVFVIPVSVIISAAMLGVVFSGFEEGHSEPGISMVFIFFACLMAYTLIGRFLFDMWLRSRTSYAVTTERILIVRPAPFGRNVSLGFLQFPEVILRSGNSQRGTLRFERRGILSLFRKRGRSLTPSLDPIPQFLAISEPDKVYAIIMQAMAARTAR